MARLSLYLLGPIQVTNADTLVVFPYDKVPALLAYLALESNRPHFREALAELFWPDRPSATSRHSLSQALSALRRALGSPTQLVLTRETVQLNSDHDLWLDTVAFNNLWEASERHAHPHRERCADCATRLEQALQLYRSDFLDQFSLSDSVAFEDWVALQRGALRQRAVQTLARLAAHAEANGNLEQAILLAQRQLAFEPYEESIHRHLMRLRSASGQRSAALAQYERCRDLLASELAVEPEAETTALYDLIRAGRPGNPEPAPTAPQHNLPAQSTPLIGRASELAQIAGLLANPDCRLLTLVGPGGIGKTRLAIEAAAAETGHFAQGVWFVALAPLSAHGLIASAVASVLSFNPYGAEGLRQRLIEFLRDQALLLVLDNFEHLVAEASLLAEIAAAAPRVKFLVTSRARLNLHSEWVILVEGLSVPDGSGPTPVEETGAGQLFVQSARRARSSFAVTDDNRPHISSICQLVSGMPLAIELAAAWLPVLSAAEVADEIAHNLDFLAAELSDVPERHRSMRAVFDHSWRLLTQPERAAFRRLSTFRGGFTREAAEAVAETALVDLSRLSAKSLLQRSASGRCQVHELLRQYGSRQLQQRPAEEQTTRARHGRYYLAFLAEREAALKGHGHQAALNEIAVETENIRAAWQWAAEHQEAQMIAQAIDALWLYNEVHGRYADAEAQFRLASDALRHAPPDLPGRALALGKCLACQGSWHMRLGRPDVLRQMVGQSLALLRPLGAQREVAFAVNMLAAGAHVEGEYVEQRQHLQESIALGQASGDQWITAYSLNDLSMATFLLGDAAEARRLCEAGLVIFRALGDQRGLAFGLQNLGVIASHVGDYAEAGRLLREDLALWRASGHQWGVATTLIHLGVIARTQQDPVTAQACFLEAIQTAMKVRTLPPALDALVEQIGRAHV